MDAPRLPITWSPEARADLKRIWDYYLQVAGANTAERMVREISEVCALLEEHPFAGRSRSEIRPDLRSALAGPHVLFYRVQRHVPEIIRVIDERQDIDEVFLHRDADPRIS